MRLNTKSGPQTAYLLTINIVFQGIYQNNFTFDMDMKAEKVREKNN